MTGTRSRSTAQHGSWGDHALPSGRPGTPGWAAVFCALGFAAAGAFADIERLNRLGIVFQACYFLGCLLGVLMVRRKGLFGPMVAPPLILVVAVPGVVLAAGTPATGGGMVATALTIGPLVIDSFPTMAITTGCVVAIGIFRLTTGRPTSQLRMTQHRRSSP